MLPNTSIRVVYDLQLEKEEMGNGGITDVNSCKSYMGRSKVSCGITELLFMKRISSRKKVQQLLYPANYTIKVVTFQQYR